MLIWLMNWAKIDDLNDRDDINAIILEGAGKSFVAGVDVQVFCR